MGYLLFLNDKKNVNFAAIVRIKMKTKDAIEGKKLADNLIMK